MIRASCHCGAVSIEIDEAPTELNECGCSICRRYGALWAYYQAEQVRIAGEGGSDTYVWGDRELVFHRCGTCGCMTHWHAIDPERRRMGVNARMMAPDVVEAAHVHQSSGPG